MYSDIVHIPMLGSQHLSHKCIYAVFLPKTTVEGRNPITKNEGATMNYILNKFVDTKGVKTL